MASLEDLSAEDRAKLNLANLLLSDPETSKQARRLAKKLKPELQFSDLDLEDRLTKQSESNAEQLKAIRADQQKIIFDREREKAHAKLRERGLDPAAVEKVMTENSIANYDLAAEVLEARAVAAAPTPDDLTALELPSGKEGEVDLWKDPKNFARRTADAVLNGFKRTRLARTT